MALRDKSEPCWDNFATCFTKPVKQSQLRDSLLLALDKKVRVTKETTQPIAVQKLAEKFPLRILVVEDNAINQRLALRFLDQLGYRSDLANNGLEAVEAVKRQTYDVILMDVQMPEMDGYEATREIHRRCAPGKAPYIIALTAHSMKGDQEKCLENGMDDYISKPVRASHIEETLLRAVSRLGLQGVSTT